MLNVEADADHALLLELETVPIQRLLELFDVIVALETVDLPIIEHNADGVDLLQVVRSDPHVEHGLRALARALRSALDLKAENEKVGGPELVDEIGYLLGSHILYGELKFVLVEFFAQFFVLRLDQLEDALIGARVEEVGLVEELRVELGDDRRLLVGALFGGLGLAFLDSIADQTVTGLHLDRTLTQSIEIVRTSKLAEARQKFETLGTCKTIFKTKLERSLNLKNKIED